VNRKTRYFEEDELGKDAGPPFVKMGVQTDAGYEGSRAKDRGGGSFGFLSDCIGEVGGGSFITLLSKTRGLGGVESAGWSREHQNRPKDQQTKKGGKSRKTLNPWCVEKSTKGRV